MANYQPVLLVSVTNTSIMPDDSSVSTLPRGQVDYLSHDWQEEDVWRSWRKMTRQKNEITNGPRLENASWRTWWKQRNKLKTVTPETLNWLKDSDVTWLYGPLHTAAEWTPPARLTTHDTGSSRRGARHKPILKYRSISELLTSELPTSPVFGPAESETETKQQTSEAQNVSVLNGLSKSLNSKRPALVHTKSDTHVARWGPDCAFRKNSPPRVDPSGSSGCIATSQSKTSDLGYFSQSQSYSQDSYSSTGTSTTGLINGRSCHTAHKKKHITFNTFVEQCISIEKPNDENVTLKLWGERKWDYDDGYEEDEEDDDDDDSEIWIRHTPHHLNGTAITGSSLGSGDDQSKEAEEEDELLEMRPRSYRDTPRKQRVARSPSTSASISTPSSRSPSTSASISTRSTSSSSPSRSLSPSSSSGRQISISAHPSVYTPRGSIRRSNTTSAYRPRPRPSSTSHHPFMRTRARGDSIHNRTAPHIHVTIAPIAPTILKTTDSGYDGWAEGFGDEGGSDDGFWGSKWGSYIDREGWKERDKVQSLDDEATPVELVYVPPPFLGHYPVGSDEEDFDIDAEDEIIEEQREDDTLRPSSNFATLRIVDDAPIAESPQSTGNDFPFVSTVTPPTANLIVEFQPLQASEVPEHSICVSGNEVASCSPSNNQDRRRPLSPEDRHSTSRSRSRTHSRSRTPSPAVSMPSLENAATPVPASVSGRSSSPAPSSSSLLCPPVQRGRSASYQDLPARAQRGRSSARTPQSYSDREQGESPIGSLSPDSSFIGVASIVGGVYANGRTDKERQKEKERREEQYRERVRGRDGERGRDRIGRKPSQSLSPDVEMMVASKRDSFSAERRADESSAPIKRSPSTLEETYYVTGMAQAPTTTYMQEASRPFCESPLLVPPPQPIEPTSLSISPPGVTQPLPVKLPQQPQSSASPTEMETTMVEKAVGIMSSAGAFLRLWHP